MLNLPLSMPEGYAPAGPEEIPHTTVISINTANAPTPTGRNIESLVPRLLVIANRTPLLGCIM
jgi:hypothetical protein